MVQGEISVLSFGGGPPSCALACLNVQEKVEPKADIAIFADTGGEKPDTYKAVEFFSHWLPEYGIQFAVVQAKEGPLAECLTRPVHGLGRYFIPIPARSALGGMFKRKCTERWKVRPIYKYLRGRFPGSTFQMQLAMTWDEAWRMRESWEKDAKNIYPLIDLHLDRQACINLLRENNLVSPPWSSCYFCPFQSVGRWQQLATRYPDLFQHAALLEEGINRRLKERPSYDGYQIFLSSRLKPLREAFSTLQGRLPLDDAGQCESGYCFT